MVVLRIEINKRYWYFKHWSGGVVLTREPNEAYDFGDETSLIAIEDQGILGGTFIRR